MWSYGRPGERLTDPRSTRVSGSAGQLVSPWPVFGLLASPEGVKSPFCERGCYRAFMIASRLRFPYEPFECVFTRSLSSRLADLSLLILDIRSRFWRIRPVSMSRRNARVALALIWYSYVKIARRECELRCQATVSDKISGWSSRPNDGGSGSVCQVEPENILSNMSTVTVEIPRPLASVWVSSLRGQPLEND